MDQFLPSVGKYILGCGLAWAALFPHHAHAKDIRILYTFGSDGTQPGNGLIRDSAHNLYGTTQAGGGGKCEYGCGTIFKLAPDGTQSVLYTFTGGDDGAGPVAALIADGQGNFYGTAVTGGAAGFGTVFRLAPEGTLAVLHGFSGGSDGARPQGGVIADESGNLYGTTVDGGSGTCEGGCGTVFEVTAEGTESVLHTFAGGKDGAYPVAGLVRDRSGNLYGTTYGGGEKGDGTVFRIAPDGRETLLHFFAGSDGASPTGGLILDRAGDLVGTTWGGSTGGCGNVFSLMRKKSFSVLYTFGRYYGGDACGPSAALVEDRYRNFYGTTSQGGPVSCGTVFKLAADGTESLLYAFTCEADGYDPQSTPVVDGTGHLYATAAGVYNGGTLFRLPE